MIVAQSQFRFRWRIGVASGTTFAWFTSNRIVSVGTINATVTTGTDGLYVSVKTGADSWSDFAQEVSSADLNTALYGAASPTSAHLASISLDALTRQSDYTLKTESGTAKTWSYTATDETPNKFIELTLKFRSTVALNIYLADHNDDSSKTSNVSTVGSPVAENQVKAWANIADSVYGTALTADTAIPARAANAARVSFISGETKNTWTTHEDGDTNEDGYYLGNLAEDYRQFFLENKTALELEDPANRAAASSIVNTVTLIQNDESNKASATVLGATTASGNLFEATVTIRIWIEGTDGDCFNSIFADQFSVDFVFIGSRAPVVAP